MGIAEYICGLWYFFWGDFMMNRQKVCSILASLILMGTHALGKNNKPEEGDGSRSDHDSLPAGYVWHTAGNPPVTLPVRQTPAGEWVGEDGFPVWTMGPHPVPIWNRMNMMWMKKRPLKRISLYLVVISNGCIHLVWGFFFRWRNESFYPNCDPCLIKVEQNEDLHLKRPIYEWGCGTALLGALLHNNEALERVSKLKTGPFL